MRAPVILLICLIFLSSNITIARISQNAFNSGILRQGSSFSSESSYIQKFEQPARNDLVDIIGTAHDIAVGADGTLWYIGTEEEDGGYSIYRLNKAINSFEKIVGGGVRITVDLDGNAWIINDEGIIYHYTGSGWEQIQGSGSDIGANGGNVWLVGAQNSIWRLNSDRRTWELLPGSANRITVDGNGNAWMTNDDMEILRWTGTTWEGLPGKASDIGAGADGTVFIAGAEKVSGGHQIWKWKETTRSWSLLPGVGATDIAVDSEGLLYAVRENLSMFKLINTNVQPNWKKVAGKAKDIGIGADGTVWCVGTEQTNDGFSMLRWDSNRNEWTRMTGSGLNVAVDTSGYAWIVDKNDNIWKYDEETWTQIEGSGFDIGVGAENSVWHTGKDYKIFRLRTDELTWDQITGAQGSRISVDQDGNAWVVTKEKKIYRYLGTRWELIPGKAVDVACGADGTVVIAGSVEGRVGNRVLKWEEGTHKWIEIPGVSPIRVAVGPTGNIYALNESYEIYSLERFW